jgi:hypothetical protein
LYHYKDYASLQEQAKVRMSSGPAANIGNKDWQEANERK